MIEIFKENLLDKIIAENQDRLLQIQEIAKEHIDRFFILVNFPGATHSHVIVQYLPLDVTIVCAEPFSLRKENMRKLVLEAYDAYPVDLATLERKTAYHTPYAALLMDSKLYYSTDEELTNTFYKYRAELESKIESPFTRENYNRAVDYRKFSEHFFSLCMTQEEIADVRKAAANMLSNVENSLVLLNKSFWHQNISFFMQELAELKIRPENLIELIDDLMCAMTIQEIQSAATILMKELHKTFIQVEDSLRPPLDLDKASELSAFLDEFFTHQTIRIKHAAKFPENKHMMYFTLLDTCTVCEESFTRLITDKTMSAWHPDDFNKTVEDFHQLKSQYLYEYKSHVR